MIWLHLFTIHLIRGFRTFFPLPWPQVKTNLTRTQLPPLSPPTIREFHRRKFWETKSTVKRRKMGTLGRAIYTVGFWIRETGQAIDRLGSRLQGNYSFQEQRTSLNHPSNFNSLRQYPPHIQLSKMLFCIFIYMQFRLKKWNSNQWIDM